MCGAEKEPENVMVEEKKKVKPPKAELLTFGDVGGPAGGGLQNHFNRFRRAKQEEVQYRNYMADQVKVDRRDPEFKK